MSDTIMPIVTSVLLAVNVDEKSSAVVHAVQSDNLSRIIRAGFTDESIIYAIDADAKVSFVVIRPDGIVIEKDCEVDPSGQYVEVTLDENILQAYGNARANFIIRDVDAEQSMRSQEFTLHIGEKLDKEEAIPTDAPVPLAKQVKKNTEDISELKKGGGVTKEDLLALQNRVSILEQKGIGGGISSESADLLCNILAEGVFGSVQLANIENLRTMLRSSTPVTPTKTLTSITATYSGGSVVEGTSVNSLTGITVTAHYSDGSTQTVTGYTRSGTIAVGSNTVTLIYQGKSTTITVTGTANSTPTPTRTLQSISATYTGGSVDAGTPATSLTGITVTGHYNVAPLTETVTGWTISGTVAEGQNTFTIYYGGKTATINVTGNASTPIVPASITWVMANVPISPGSIAGSISTNTSTTRMSTQQIIPVNGLLVNYSNPVSRIDYYAYDQAKSYLGSGQLSSGNGEQLVLTAQPSAVYVRLMARTGTSTEITLDHAQYIDITYVGNLASRD